MEAYVGTILLWPVNFAPDGWAFCDGSLLPVNGNQALFSLIGTTYGGNGQTNFALPDLRGRVPVCASALPGPGMSHAYQLGEKGGLESNTLTAAQMPAHNHLASATGVASAVSTPISIPAVTGSAADVIKPGNTVVLGKMGSAMYSSATPDTTLEQFTANGTVTPNVTVAIANAGNNAPVENRQPYLGLNFIICLNGTYPVRP